MDMHKRTELNKLIGATWFRPLKDLSEESSVPKRWITQAVNGGEIPKRYEETLTKYLQAL